jgi:hypothetical protein
VAAGRGAARAGRPVVQAVLRQSGRAGACRRGGFGRPDLAARSGRRARCGRHSGGREAAGGCWWATHAQAVRGAFAAGRGLLCFRGRAWLREPGRRPRVVGGGASRRGGWGAGSAPSRCGCDHRGLRCHGGCGAGVARWLVAELKLCAACSAPTIWVCSSPRLCRNNLPPSSRTRR